MLRTRFPTIVGPHREDICYATTNRQNAVKAIAGKVDCLIVVGSPQSSNSLRLVEVAERAGCRNAFLLERASGLDWDKLPPLASIGLTAGASAPEVIVDEVIDAFAERYDVSVDIVTSAVEHVVFNVPRQLRASAG